MFNKMKDTAKMIKEMNDMKKKMKKVQKELKTIQISAIDKTGMVKVILTGELECVEVSIDPTLKTPENKEKLEKALIQAFNDASSKAKNIASEKLAKVSQGLNIPGFGGPSIGG